LWNQLYAYESGVIAFMASLNQEDEYTVQEDIFSTVLKKKTGNGISAVNMLDRIFSVNDTRGYPVRTVVFVQDISSRRKSA
jgi:hypothetical protein